MNRICRFISLAGALLLALPAVSSAHPETGFLPDSVAETEYRIVVEINPKDIQTRNKLGIVLYRKNKLGEAAWQFGEVLKVSPRDFDAHDGMGLVSCKTGNYKEAVAWFTKAIVLRREDTMVHYGLGFAHEQLGNLAVAEKCYREALAVNSLLLQRGVNRELENGKKKIVLAALQNIRKKRAQAGGKR
ncbi:tetratricopeptide repeat protein [Geotalea uraniireducens]|uniref:Tetratricopeptide TPR_2 repeat protein n=1 Tax=Geotalea uraniireducens (strain Rf4) TaxID=351605 RepID=A5G574_GEOUR|nr:tetratricopeptide repeat protein [Geotalea uraniireducens]ABQ26942.1 Tetratricopeptide TPR_2 repeat protein [Geotalea uraniireducens Rf4]